MIEVIPFASLGRFDNEWLAARYHFSFANYHHRERNGFGPLLVWTDDTIQPGTGFPRHSHRDLTVGEPSRRSQCSSTTCGEQAAWAKSWAERPMRRSGMCPPPVVTGWLLGYTAACRPSTPGATTCG